MPTRRQLLRGAGGAIVIVLGGLQIACTREESAELDSAGLQDPELLTLVAMMQRIVPHENLDSAVYHDAVQAFLRTARENPTIVDGLADLQATGFVDLSIDDQIASLNAIEDTPFFDTVRGAAVRSLYADERTWEMLGYGGDASRYGGYIDLGFNDIDWLPDV